MGNALNINDLSDEQKKLYGIPTEASSPFTRPETDPNADVNDPLYVDTDVVPTVNPDFGWQQLIDMDEPDIKREQESQLFDGSTYQKYPAKSTVKPFLGPEVPVTDESKKIKQSNDALYRETGHALIPGWESGPRLQDSVDKGGDKETAFVPPESMSDPISRSVVGGALEAAKGVALLPGYAAEAVDGRNWANFLTQNLPLSSQMKEELLIAKPNAVEIINSSMPTFPAGSPMEKMAQEIISIVIGGAGGAKATEKAIEALPGAQKLIAQNAADFLESFGKKGEVDVVNAQQKTEAFIKSMVTEFGGANTGATITTPDDSEPLTGSTFVDNTIASGIFRAFGLAYKGARNFVGAGVGSSATAPITETGLAADLFRQVDPDVVNVSQEEFLRRAKVFSETITDNATVTNRTFGDSTLGPASAMYQGARSYVDKAYGYLKTSLPEARYEEWANNKAAQIANEFQAVKRTNLDKGVVQAADANMLDQGKTAISKQAEALGPYGDSANIQPGTTLDAANNIAIPALQKLNDAKYRIDLGARQVESAQNNLDSLTDGNAFLDEIDKNNPGSMMDRDLEQITDKRAKAIAAQDKWKKSHDDYKGKFGSLPVGKGFNVQELADMLEDFGNQDDLGKLFNIEGGAPTQKFGKMAEDAEGIPVDKLNVIDNLSGKDMRWLVTEARPYFTQQLEAQKYAALNGATPVNIPEYTQIIKFIDEQADGLPGFKEAKESYANHMQRWGQLEETKRLNLLNKQSDNAVQKGADESYRAMYDFQDRVLKDPDGSGVMLKNWMQAFDVNDKEAGKMVMSELVGALATVDVKQAKALASIIRPYMPKLATVDQKAYGLVNEALKDVEAASSGLVNAKTSNAGLLKEAETLKSEVADTAANDFITQQFGKDPVFAREGVGKALDTTFADPTKTRKLFTEADATDNPLVRKGLQGQYLRWINDNIFTSKVVSATGSGRGVTEASVSKLNQILDGSSQKWKETMKVVFSDQPQFLEDFDLLLNTLRDDVNVRSNKPQTFSSNTAVDTARNARQQAAGLLTTVLFGRLNRTAATVGAFAKAVNTAMGSNEEAALLQILPTLLTDSKKLTSTLDEIVKNPKKEDIGHIVDKLVDNSANLTNTAKGVGFTTLVPEKEDDTENALGVK